MFGTAPDSLTFIFSEFLREGKEKEKKENDVQGRILARKILEKPKDVHKTRSQMQYTGELIAEK